MCELFGISASKQINIAFTLKKFYARGKSQPDGWGLATYPDHAAMIIKESFSPAKSSLEKCATTSAKTHLLISHLRSATVGKKLFQNTHPFSRELRGEEWVFAHNGTVRGVLKKKLTSFFPLGTTDSEHAFCYLLDSLKTGGKSNPRRVIERAAAEIASFGSFNFLLSNGKSLYAYKTGPTPLHMIEVACGKNGALLEDDHLHVCLPSAKNLKATFFATAPLTKDAWTPCEENKLYEFADGKGIS